MNYASRLFALLFAALLIGSIVSPAEAQDEPFITVWDTENNGETDDDQIKIPGTGTDYQIIWEELGNTSNTDTLTATDEVTITFPNPGLYRIKISGDFTRIHFGKYLGDGDFETGDFKKIISVRQWGDIEWSTMKSAFRNAINVDISADDIPNLSNVSSTHRMFMNCISLTAFSSNINNWNTGNIEDMSSMFQGASSFNKNLNGWNTSAVTDMSKMFKAARLFTGNISEWNTGNVINMSQMFVASFFNDNISGWNTGSVKYMGSMFRYAENFNQDIGSWNVSSVENMSRMFSNASSFNQNLYDWDVSNVTNMFGMFSGANSFNGDIGSWNISNVVFISNMFSGASSFNQDINSWNTSSVSDMSGTFRNASSFKRPIGEWNVSNVEDMSSMFRNASSFNKNLGEWDTSSLESIANIFSGATDFNRSLARWDVSNVSTMLGALSYTSISPENYDRTISSWAGQDVMLNVQLDAKEIKFCDSSPLRNHLVESLGWSIEDAGKKTGCPKDLSSSESQLVDQDGQYVFDNVGVSLIVRSSVESGLITIARYSSPPIRSDSISKDNISQYRTLVYGQQFTALDSTEVRFDEIEFGGINDPEDVFVYKRSSSHRGAFTPLSTKFDLGAIVVNIDSFGEFVFASDSMDNPLPVEMAGFNATANGKSVRLTWRTAAETGNAGFEVQRQREDGWTQVGFVDSKASSGSTTETQSYGFMAEDLSVGTHQFRLKQVDLDGSSEVHGPITARVQMQEAIRLTPPVPNPVSSTATLSFAVKDQAEARVAVYDMLGRKVSTLFEGRPTPGESTRVRLDAGSLPSGSYIIRLRADGQTETQRMTIVR